MQEARQAAEKSRDKNADYYDFAPVGAIDLDEDGIIRGINLSGTAMLGAERRELLGLPFASFVPAENQEVYRNHLLECKRSSEGVITELLLNTRKGVPTKVQIFSYPKQDPDRVVYRTLMTELSSRQQADEKSGRKLIPHFPLSSISPEYFRLQSGQIPCENSASECWPR